MKYSLHPGAEGDLREAAEFYRDQAGSSLSQALFDEFSHCVGMLLEHPGLGAVWHGKTRRYPLKRFPYSLVYTVSEAEIRILAVAHQSRRPGYWRGRK